MPNLVAALKGEIARVARKELRGELDHLRKSTAQYRSEIASLKRRIIALEQQTKRLGKTATSKAASALPAESESVKLRFRTDGFATLRKKLGLSAEAMGKLIGVSGQSVYKWEAGKAYPRASQLQAIAAIRKLGKREALARLAAG
ncbi:MAG TPA: helix-turn-helix transcriptional regulator [Burkholderiaceae bacterium]|nr:helix-turn-helix transcriptional regulator [Burkholderiaceae bacterium]